MDPNMARTMGQSHVAGDSFDDNYVLEYQLGQASLATVYRPMHRFVPGSQYAVKVFNKTLDARKTQTILRECSMMKHVKHHRCVVLQST